MNNTEYDTAFKKEMANLNNLGHLIAKAIDKSNVSEFDAMMTLTFLISRTLTIMEDDTDEADEASTELGMKLRKLICGLKDVDAIHVNVTNIEGTKYLRLYKDIWAGLDGQKPYPVLMSVTLILLSRVKTEYPKQYDEFSTAVWDLCKTHEPFSPFIKSPFITETERKGSAA